ncbi:aminotransferase class I/II-fold pyridoxal phosphate-dependent enzyme [Kriegella aquimaris]|uniref:8-amino-7-oxononanoate synthase n=1 Tax=Kriegella aquimaris TaxID=192904 RepID=A0A1G9M052_9FLAO|nr:8-amino-7-oxononanoate synthase [Kriegella aquimaris]SDL67660.1 8-amino-7-oxononanoate synthase [Kriegella aquimaris]
MAQFPKKLEAKLVKREEAKALRSLIDNGDLVDFSSNDYLGFSRDESLIQMTSQILSTNGRVQNGATGSRLLTGNHSYYTELEKMLATFHETEAALVFNSGYDANIGFFSAVPQRGDIVLYDEYIHASIRDGINLGNAKSYKFKHNSFSDLEKKCEAERSQSSSDLVIYIVTESVFSMDGDSPDLRAMAEISEKYNCLLVVDEAHAIGVFGKNGEGLVQQMNLQDDVFARIITFGKAIGAHGATVLGSAALKTYLVNFARSFIYTTGLPPHTVASISAAYTKLDKQHEAQVQLREKIDYFNEQVESLNLKSFFIPSTSAIHCWVFSGNDQVRSIGVRLQREGFDIRPILSPTVPKGKERLRICLHSFNTKKEIRKVLQLLAIFTKEV